MAFLSCNELLELLPNGSRVSCGPPAHRRNAVGRASVPSGHNIPLPLKRSPPASFKRWLGVNAQSNACVAQGAVEQRLENWVSLAAPRHHALRPVQILPPPIQ